MYITSWMCPNEKFMQRQMQFNIVSYFEEITNYLA